MTRLTRRGNFSSSESAMILKVQDRHGGRTCVPLTGPAERTTLQTVKRPRKISRRTKARAAHRGPGLASARPAARFPPFGDHPCQRALDRADLAGARDTLPKEGLPRTWFEGKIAELEEGPATAAASLDVGLRIAREAEDLSLQIQFLRKLALLSWHSFALGEVIEHVSVLRAIVERAASEGAFDSLAHDAYLADILVIEGLLNETALRNGAAAACFQEAADRAERARYWRRVATSLALRGRATRFLGDGFQADAVQHLHQALDLAKRYRLTRTSYTIRMFLLDVESSYRREPPVAAYRTLRSEVPENLHVLRWKLDERLIAYDRPSLTAYVEHATAAEKLGLHRLAHYARALGLRHAVETERSTALGVAEEVLTHLKNLPQASLGAIIVRDVALGVKEAGLDLGHDPRSLQEAYDDLRESCRIETRAADAAASRRESACQRILGLILGTGMREVLHKLGKGSVGWRILQSLARREGQPVSKEALAEEVWERPLQDDGAEETLEQGVSRLRDDLRTMDRHLQFPIETVRGVGYRLALTR